MLVVGNPRPSIARASTPAARAPAAGTSGAATAQRRECPAARVRSRRQARQARSFDAEKSRGVRAAHRRDLLVRRSGELEDLKGLNVADGVVRAEDEPVG